MGKLTRRLKEITMQKIFFGQSGKSKITNFNLFKVMCGALCLLDLWSSSPRIMHQHINNNTIRKEHLHS